MILELIQATLEPDIMRLIGTCAQGTEEAVLRELRSFEISAGEEARGAVHFEGSLQEAYRAVLWSRTLSRVLLPVHQAEVDNEDDLYEACREVAWTDHFPLDATFVVDAVARGERWNQRFVALRAKDAIVDAFRAKVGARPDVDRESPDLRIHLHVRGTKLSLFVDLGGGPLHRRGYRQGGAVAPLRENLAASILWLAGWPESGSEGRPLLDPMMGSGTLPIEAALMLAKHAPGLSGQPGSVSGPPRRWLGHNPQLWEELREEARASRLEAKPAAAPLILGRDLSGEAVQIARRAAAAAGVGSWLEFEQGAFAESEPPEGAGLLVTNPPYGERVEGGELIAELYGQIGDVLRRRYLGWRCFILSGNPSLQRNIGLKPARKKPLFNGGIECRLLEYPIDKAPVSGGGPGWRERSPEAEMFANRLRKNRRRWEKWAKRAGVSCYRLYDADIPEYNVALDRYDQSFVLHEYRAPKKIPEGQAERRLRDAVGVVLEEFGIEREDLHLRRRQRQRDRQQYERRGAGVDKKMVNEGGHRFWVNLQDYLDTGLFMDQRPLRRRIQQESQGKSFLNLFAYTATASVYAAQGGARESVSVDLSNTYLDWAEENFRLNRMDLTKHRRERQDCFAWLERDRRTFDIILLAPPSYSRSKGMRGDFDVVRDHVKLVRQASVRLAEGGVLYFVHHARRFKMDDAALAGLQVEEISAHTVAEDFKRSPHRAWRITRLS